MARSSRSGPGSQGAQPTGPMSPSWAPRVEKHLISRLYAADAAGIVDEELIDEVGVAFLARCMSILTATEASRGRAACPVCREMIEHVPWRREDLRCAGCGWEGTWRAYQASYRHKQLYAGGMEPYLQDYVTRFPQARTAREKMILIDSLLHRFHWEMTQDMVARPGATNLVEGRMRDIIPFLEELTFGPGNAPEVGANRAAWLEKRERLRAKWRV